MNQESARQRVHPLWWTAALVVIVVGLITLSMALFAGKLTPSVSVILASDRAGLVMNPGARVKMRGVQVGRVAGISRADGTVRLQLDIDTDQIKYIPANVGAQINVNDTTISGNGTGVQAGGTIRLSNSDISFNSTAITGSGAQTYGNNRISGNGAVGSAPTAASPGQQ